MANRYRTFSYSIVLLAFLTSISLAGPHDRDKKQIRLGFIGKSTSNPVFIAAQSGAHVAAKELGDKYNIEIIIEWKTPASEDAQEQAKAIEQFTRSNIAGYALACSDDETLTPFINKSVDHGIPVVCFDADAPASKRFAFYGTDNVEFGHMLMKELAQVMSEKGVIAISGGNKHAPNLQLRIEGIKEELKNYPAMKLLPKGEVYHDESPKKAAKTVMATQKSYPQIEGWIFVGGWPLFEEHGITWKPGSVKIVAADGLPKELSYIESGHAQVLIAQNCFLWGYKSVELLINKIINKQVPAKQLNNGMLLRVTSANLDEWSMNWKKWLLKEALNK